MKILKLSGQKMKNNSYKKNNCGNGNPCYWCDYLTCQNFNRRKDFKCKVYKKWAKSRVNKRRERKYRLENISS